MSPDLDTEVLTFLSDPATYAEGTGRIELRETHISRVFLTDEYAYKVKKPVRFDFLDFSTLAQREHFCRRELLLNRRLAPDVYVDVLPIVRSEGRLQFGGDGEVVEWCVQMRRLPQGDMLDERVRRGEARESDIDRVMDVLCPFFTEAATGEEISDAATPGALEANARGNFESLESLPSEGGAIDHVAQVEAAQLGLLALRPDLFQERIAAARIRDGHGDLRAEHICLHDPPVVFDCIEFNDRFRYNDVISELSFLAMDLEFLAAPELGRYLLQEYQRRTGDRPPAALVGFYKSYRACVRSKVEALRAAETEPDRARDPLNRAARFLQLAAYATLEFYRPRLIVVMGLMGTGKTTLAHALRRQLGARVISSDRVRKELVAGIGSEAGYGQGIYRPEVTARVYEAMRLAARDLLGRGASVVLDATYKLRGHRAEVRSLAQEMGADLFFVQCACPEPESIARLERRRRRGEDVSDARPELYASQRAEFEPTTELSPHELLVLDSRATLPELTRSVLEALPRLASCQ